MSNSWFRFRPAIALAIAVAASSVTALPARATTLRETTLAQVSVRELPKTGTVSGRYSLSGLDAGYGYVGWLEHRQAGGGESRIVIEHGTDVRRTRWRRHLASFRILRGIDQASASPVVRVSEVVCLTLQPSIEGCSVTLLSPRTLRRSSTVWTDPPMNSDPYSGPNVAVEGATRITESTVFGPLVTAPTGGVASSSECTFVTGTSAQIIPALPDCISPALRLRGSLLVADFRHPSATLNPVDDSAAGEVDVFDLRTPSDGWRLIAPWSSGKAGSAGTQAICVLDHGVATLQGEIDAYGLENAARVQATWSLSVQPVGSVLGGWSAPAPQFDFSASRVRFVNSDIACSGSTVYALYSVVDNPNAGPKETIRGSVRVVRLQPVH
jgi:hypothetical protein